MEEWKPVVGYEDSYEVSNYGRVRSVDRIIVDKNGVESFHRGFMKKQTDNKVRGKAGYLVVRLLSNGVGITRVVHRLVAEAFIPNENNLPTVNHIDGNKQNNHVDNLEWVSFADNNIHALHTNLRSPRGTPIRQLSVDGKVLGEYKSTYEASRQTGVGICSISNVLNGRTKTGGGFRWERISQGVTTIHNRSTAGDELPSEAHECSCNCA